MTSDRPEAALGLHIEDTIGGHGCRARLSPSGEENFLVVPLLLLAVW